MKKVIMYLWLLLAVVSQLIACGGKDDGVGPGDDFDVRFELPASVDVAQGGECIFLENSGGGEITRYHRLVHPRIGIRCILRLSDR